MNKKILSLFGVLSAFLVLTLLSTSSVSACSGWYCGSSYESAYNSNYYGSSFNSNYFNKPIFKGSYNNYRYAKYASGDYTPSYSSYGGGYGGGYNGYSGYGGYGGYGGGVNVGWPTGGVNVRW